MTFRQCAAPVVVIATILGAVELLRSPSLLLPPMHCLQ